MKKLLTVLLSVLMVVCLFGCQGGGENPDGLFRGKAEALGGLAEPGVVVGQRIGEAELGCDAVPGLVFATTKSFLAGGLGPSPPWQTL